MSFFTELMNSPYQFWLVLGGCLLITELFGTAGYLLWSGISAIIIGAITWLIPLSWHWQWVCFSVLTLIIVIYWWDFLRKRNQTMTTTLNRPYQEFLGKKYILVEPLHQGLGRVKVADSTWRVQGDEELPEGTMVEVTGLNGSVFIVHSIQSQ